MDVTLSTAPTQVRNPEAPVEEPMTCAYCPFDAYREVHPLRALCTDTGDFVRFDEPMCRRATIKRILAADVPAAELRVTLAAHGVVLQGLCF